MRADIKDAFLVTDIRVLNKHLGRSICLFARTGHSAHALCSRTLLRSAPYVLKSSCARVKVDNICSFILGDKTKVIRKSVQPFRRRPDIPITYIESGVKSDGGFS